MTVRWYLLLWTNTDLPKTEKSVQTSPCMHAHCHHLTSNHPPTHTSLLHWCMQHTRGITIPTSHSHSSSMCATSPLCLTSLAAQCLPITSWSWTCWNSFCDLCGIHTSLTEMHANGVASDMCMCGLVDNVRHKVGMCTLWLEEGGWLRWEVVVGSGCVLLLHTCNFVLTFCNTL